MRVAICVSGQLRDWEVTHSSVVDFIARSEADVFIHTWDKAGRTSAYDRLFGSSYLASLFIERTARGVWQYDDRIWERLVNVNELFYTPRSIDEGALRAKFRPAALVLEKEPEEWRAKRKLNGVEYPKWLLDTVSARHINSMAMYYKIWAADQLMRASNSAYDVVVRLRLDTTISNLDAVLDQMKFVEEDVVYLPTTDRLDFANDMFAFGTSKTMMKYASVWLGLAEYWALDRFPDFDPKLRTAETLLDFHLKNVRLDRHLVPTRVYLHQEVCPVDEDETLVALEEDMKLLRLLRPNEERAISFLRERQFIRDLAGFPRDQLKIAIKDKAKDQYIGRHTLPPMHYSAGLCAERVGDLGLAEFHLKAAHHYYGTFWPDPTNEFARVLRKRGDLVEAVSVLSMAVARFPKSYYSWRDLAYSYAALLDATGHAAYRDFAIAGFEAALMGLTSRAQAPILAYLDRLRKA